MTPFATLVQQGSERAWLFIPSAITLGILHGLEPGHSKTMMASFIVAIRGSVKQAALLGLAATASHTAVIWLIALTGLYFGQEWYSEATEPYFQMVSAVTIVAIALWMMWRTWADQRAVVHGHSHEHTHDHSHGDAHHRDSTHERQHAEDIVKRFNGREATTGQIVMFGLTGGLVPCPAAVTVLLICLQMREVGLGVVLVLCFSIGLAITLVASGTIAAWGMKRASARWPGITLFMARAPYISSTLILAVGVYVGWEAMTRHLLM